jgi:hypothetical protein
MLLKKILIGILLVVLAVVGLIGGKMYLEENKIVSIVKSDDGKEAVESMLKSMDDKALTPEGKIKSYKIDFDKVEKNPMGGINIYLIINDDPEMKLDTTLVKFNKDGKYETGARGISPKLFRLVYGERG